RTGRGPCRLGRTSAGGDVPASGLCGGAWVASARALPSPLDAARWSYPADLLGAEQAVGPDEQDGQHQQVGDDPGEAHSEERDPGQELRRQRLGEADREPADHRPDDGVEAAEDDGGEGGEGEKRRRLVDARRPPREQGQEYPGHAGEEGTYPPRDREDSADVDALGAGGLLVEGGGAHGDAEAAAEEQGDEGDEDDRGGDLGDDRPGDQREAFDRPHVGPERVAQR